MKLAALYTVFNGAELLKPSIESIQKHVDGVLVCWQITSNKGNKIEEVDSCHITKVRPGVAASTLHWVPDLSKDDKVNERNKHNYMIQWAVGQGYTHAIMMAVDHFYEESQFATAKDKIRGLDVDVTFTKMFTYYKHPTWQLVPIEDYLCTFIVKLNEGVHIAERQYPAAYHVDPSVRLSPASTFHTFEENEIMLHHHSMVRNDISNKLQNAAIYRNQGVEPYIEEWNNYDINLNAGVSYFHGRKIQIVPDYFSLARQLAIPQKGHSSSS